MWQTVSRLESADGAILAEISMFNGKWYCIEPRETANIKTVWIDRVKAKQDVMERLTL